jgi:hypothetical protein
MQRKRYFAQTTRPADATAYTAGDEIANSATAGSVVRMSFDLSGFTRGRIIRACMDITPASSNLVITALNLNAIIFKHADAPAAVGDNVALSIAAPTRSKAIGHLLFDDGAWVNPAGAFAAGTSGWQETPATMSLPLATPAIAEVIPEGYFFEFNGNSDIANRSLDVVLQVLGAWTPLGVVNTIGMCIDVEVE